MKPLFVCYPKCSTCIKAQKWLQAQGIEVQVRHIAQQNPTAAELRQWVALSGLPVRKFFNTSGLKYKEMNLKERVGHASDAELIELLASDGMLVKRPVLVLPDRVLVGFREPEWSAALL